MVAAPRRSWIGADAEHTAPGTTTFFQSTEARPGGMVVGGVDVVVVIRAVELETAAGEDVAPEPAPRLAEHPHVTTRRRQNAGVHRLESTLRLSECLRMPDTGSSQ
jgi:hypothetical protein